MVTTTCFDHACSHLQGGNNNNTDMFIIVRDHSTIKSHVVLVTIPAVLPFNRNFKQNCTILFVDLS